MKRNEIQRQTEIYMSAFRKEFTDGIIRIFIVNFTRFDMALDEK